MNELTTKDREGYTRIFYRNNGGWGDIAAKWHPSILEAWNAGKPFFSATDCWGDPIEIKLAEVCAIGLGTVAGMARFKVDEDIEDARQKSRDLLSGGG